MPGSQLIFFNSKNFYMKRILKKSTFWALIICSAIFLGRCKKDIKSNPLEMQPAALKTLHGHLKQTNTYSSDVVFAWMNLQLRIMRTATGIPNVAFARPYAYSGITLYEAVVNGMPAYQSLQGQLNGLTGLPQTTPGLAYHWASVANAALALINKRMFPTTSIANKNAIDSLENELNAQYAGDTDPEIASRSVQFGRDVAQKIFDWSETDGYTHASDAYPLPGGIGLWVPTAPAFAAASTPYWGNLRTIVPGSGKNTQPGAPTAYSTDPSSDFYKMVKQVYDASQTLTPEQTAMAMYWRDIPGVTTPGHYLSILEQVLEKEKSTLDQSAVAYALCAITVNDAAISCWKTKYTYNLVRPITYIRNVLGHASWLSLLATPAHPEYSSAHAVLSEANADALTSLFGDNYSFTDHTYDYLGFPSRSFNSFHAIAVDAGNSRLYAGIHYQPSIDAGLEQGSKVAANVIGRLRFLK
jgi:hypothetical protein